MAGVSAKCALRRPGVEGSGHGFMDVGPLVGILPSSLCLPDGPPTGAGSWRGHWVTMSTAGVWRPSGVCWCSTVGSYCGRQLAVCGRLTFVGGQPPAWRSALH